MRLPRFISMLLMLSALPLAAQQPSPQAKQPQVLDRVLAIVNDDVLLSSDLEEEIRYNRFQSLPSAMRSDERKTAFSRLLNRTLILQQIQPQDRQASEPTDAEFEKSFAEFKESLPACARDACATDEGWDAVVREAGFDPAMVAHRWRERMMILRFIELRYRQGITITEDDVRNEYEKNWVPEFKRRKLNVVPLPLIEDRIRENLLQRRMNSLLQEWLRSLREQGTLEIIDPTLRTAEEKDEDDDGGAE